MTTFDHNALVERYIDIWNEADPDRRRDGVRELWAVDGELVNERRAYRGVDELCVAVQRSFEGFIAGGHRYRPAGPPMAHHDGVGVPWEMLAPGSDDVAARGVNFLLLDDTRAIACDYQFVAREGD